MNKGHLESLEFLQCMCRQGEGAREGGGGMEGGISGAGWVEGEQTQGDERRHRCTSAVWLGGQT